MERIINNNTLLRLTTYNVAMVCIILLTNTQSQWTDIIKTTSLLISVIVFLIVLIIPSSELLSFYKKASPIIPSNIYIIHIYNFIIHFLPPILLGLPSHTMYIVIGYGIVYLYFMILRISKKIQELYIDTISNTTYDIVVISSGVFVAVLLTMF